MANSYFRGNGFEDTESLRRVAFDDIVDGSSVVTPTGDQTLEGALNSRVISISDLNSLISVSTDQLVDGQQFNVKEYALGDGFGGGIFYWDASSTESDDGGAVIQIPGVSTGRFHRIINGFVTPEMYGGGLNSIISAVSRSETINTPLSTGEKVYEVDEELVLPEGLVWHSFNSTLKQNSEGTSISGVVPLSNTVIYGNLTIDMGSLPSGTGSRCHVRIDNFHNIEPQVSGFSFDTIICSGGHPNCNGVVAAGGANKIRGKKIECGDSSVIGRLFMAHWGNFTQHYRDDSVSPSIYRHEAGYSPTTHPNDIRIDEVVAGTLSLNSNDYQAIALVSAGYDIHFGRVKGIISDRSNSGRSLLTWTAGDISFAYATNEVKEHGARNLSCDFVEGESATFAVNAIGLGLFWDRDDSSLTQSEFYAKIQDTIQLINVKGSGELVNSNAYSGNNGKGKTNIGEISGSDFESAFASFNHTSNVRIGRISTKRCHGNVATIAGSGVDETIIPVNITIGEIILDDYGISGFDESARYGVRNQKTLGCTIGKIICKLQGSNGFRVMNNNHTDAGNGGYVGVINIEDPDFNDDIAVLNESPNNKPFQLDGYFDISGTASFPVSGGTLVRSAGRVREYTVFGGVPSGLDVIEGDRFWDTNTNTGASVLRVVSTGGVTGSTAAFKTLITAP